MPAPRPVPPSDPGRWWPLAIVAVVLLLLGGLVASGIGAALGLTWSTPPLVAEPVPEAASAPAAAQPEFRQVVVPATPPLRLAAAELATSIAATGAPEPAVRRRAEGTAPSVTASVDPRLDGTEQAYRLHWMGRDLRVTGASAPAAASGLYAVADRIRSGRDPVPPGQDGTVIEPRLPLRLTDAGAVGIDADESRFAAGTDYSHNNSVVATAILPDEPFVADAAVAEIARQFRQFVDHSLAQGYNGVVIPGFLEYVTFAGVGDGTAVYRADDPRRARAAAMVRAFRPVWRYAAVMGMQVYFSTDMLALTPPLRDYLQGEHGGLAVEDASFWGAYQAAFDEFLDQMPYAAGLMLRIGEGGEVYDLPGMEFTSEIAVRTPAAVQQMLAAFLATAEQRDKTIIFRSWTVGVGTVGDLHTNPQTYADVLGPVDSPALIVSTKFTAGDFYSYLPFNPTLTTGDHRRIVEFQARREYEGFGSLPNDLGPVTKQALDLFLAANPNVVGVWNWTQYGGPLRAGARILHLREGFWQLADLNTYAAGRLATDPDADPAAITRDWARRTFSDDPATVAAIVEVMAQSRDAITQGLYIGPYARQTVKALGLEPPPMMWLFEWDILTGDSAVWDSIYAVSRDQLDEAVAEGAAAPQVVREMRAEIAATDPGTWRDPVQRQQFLDTLDYQASLFETLGAYRELMLRHAEWLDTGDTEAKDQWLAARDRYVEARTGHVAAYGGNTALPAFNFTAADLGTERADRDELMAWLARGLLVLIAGALLLGLTSLPGAVGMRALWIGLTRPWRLADADLALGRVDRVVVWAVPLVALVGSRAILTWFAAPAHLVVTLGACLLFLVVLRWAIRDADPFWLWAAVGGAVLLRTILLLVALARRGPGRYWLHFWTDPTMRTVYVTLAFAAFCGCSWSPRWCFGGATAWWGVGPWGGCSSRWARRWSCSARSCRRLAWSRR